MANSVGTDSMDPSTSTTMTAASRSTIRLGEEVSFNYSLHFNKAMSKADTEGAHVTHLFDNDAVRRQLSSKLLTFPNSHRFLFRLIFLFKYYKGRRIQQTIAAFLLRSCITTLQWSC
jgi:hypothetical protein